MLQLPTPIHTPLRSPALPLVVAQARYAGVRAEVTAEVISAVQARMRQVGAAMDRVAPLTSTNIVIGQGVTVPPQVSQAGAQLATEDGQWQATVTGEWVSLETPSFRSYQDDFRPLWAELLAAISAALVPAMLVRTGLRFVNVLKPPEPSEPGEPDGSAEPTVLTSTWSRWVHPALAGPEADDWLREGLLNFGQQMLLEVGPGVSTGVRSGPAEEDGKRAFLLDLDTFSEPQAVWDGGNVLARFDELNGCGVALFQSLVTPEMLNHLRGDDHGVAEDAVRGEERR